MPRTATITRLPRRTQEERSASTRARLLDATISCLSELGYGRTTTTEIAERAGVSRGAQLHHFPTKAELVTTAVEHLFEKRTEEFRKAFATLPAGIDRTAAAVDLLWSMVSGPTFHAWLELVVAARTDAELRKTVSAIGKRFGDNVDRTYRELFPGAPAASPFFDLAPMFTFGLLQGLALDQMSGGEEAKIVMVIGLLKGLAAMVFPEGNAPRRAHHDG
jgi:AcrR family transcriptional regulator